MVEKSELDTNRALISKFLQDIPIQKKYLEKEPFGYIYCIENKKTKMKYIGSTYSRMIGNAKPIPYTQLRKRASNYLYEYKCVLNNKSSAKQYSRPIIKAMCEDGFENFIMYPLAETRRSNHAEMEKMFMRTFDTLNNGYNVNPAGANMNKSGTKLMAKDKLLRSEGIVAINPNRKEIIFSESMKLFGDYLNSSKDMIKNSNRKGRPYRGWFIFYIDRNKRSFVLEHNVLNEEGKPKNEAHSEKAKAHYKELCETVGRYLESPNANEYFIGFTVLPMLAYKD